MLEKLEDILVLISLLPLHISSCNFCGCRCPWTRRFDRTLEDAAAEWYPDIKFVRVILLILFYVSEIVPKFHTFWAVACIR